MDALPRLLALAAGRTASLVNISELAAPFQVSRPTIREYVTLLSRIFLLEELPPWHSNRLKRLIKTPKRNLTDSGLACALLGLDVAALAEDRTTFGRLLETFVFQELRRQAGWLDEPVTMYHYRYKDQVEVDLVLESGGRLAGVKVKAGSTVTGEDCKGLRRLQEAEPKRFAAGVVLYDGDAVVPFGPQLYAVPLSTLWSEGWACEPGMRSLRTGQEPGSVCHRRGPPDTQWRAPHKFGRVTLALSPSMNSPLVNSVPPPGIEPICPLLGIRGNPPSAPIGRRRRRPPPR